MATEISNGEFIVIISDNCLILKYLAHTLHILSAAPYYSVYSIDHNTALLGMLDYNTVLSMGERVIGMLNT